MMCPAPTDFDPQAAGHPAVVTEPVFQQLARICRDMLAAGAVKPGEQFPSERELAGKYGISRATANKVLNNLTAEGLLEKRPGIGMFAATTKSLHASLREMESFTGHARALGLAPATQVLAFQRLKSAALPPKVTSGLKLQDGEEVFYTERLRLVDKDPVILEFRWIRAALVPGLKKASLAGSFYALLENKYQITLVGEQHEIWARNLTAEEARKLAVMPGTAALVVEGPGYAGNNAAVWYQTLLYRGDKYHLENVVRLHRQLNTTEMKLRRFVD